MMFALLLMTTPAAEDPYRVCYDPHTQAEINMCARRDYERADSELNAQWKATVAVMKARDSKFIRGADKRPGYFDTLLAAQRAWLTYRDKHCASAGYSMRGGSAESMVVGHCKTKLTEARTAQLRDLIGEY